ncbi:hypothetical protein NM962_01245 [Mycobacterium sp. SVM_VP21]|nr:hypothetical protein NM962_01245 [Mycobacterium sp. SVM_VP21]
MDATPLDDDDDVTDVRSTIDPDSVLKEFLAGSSYRQIAEDLVVGEQIVEDVIRAAMIRTAPRREFLAENFDAVTLERREAIFQAQYRVAISRSEEAPAAARICVKLLEGMRDNLAAVGNGVAATTTTEDALKALRNKLSAEIDVCRDARKLTSLSRQFLAVCAELDAKAPPPHSKRDEVKAKREQRRAAAGRSNPADSGSATS